MVHGDARAPFGEAGRRPGYMFYIDKPELPIEVVFVPGKTVDDIAGYVKTMRQEFPTELGPLADEIERLVTLHGEEPPRPGYLSIDPLAGDVEAAARQADTPAALLEVLGIEPLPRGPALEM